jgi:hypothetical protein
MLWEWHMIQHYCMDRFCLLIKMSLVLCAVIKMSVLSCSRHYLLAGKTGTKLEEFSRQQLHVFFLILGRGI